MKENNSRVFRYVVIAVICAICFGIGGFFGLILSNGGYNYLSYIDEYLVDYWYTGNGLILYDYKSLKKTAVRAPDIVPERNQNFNEQRGYSHPPSHELCAVSIAAIIFAPAN